MKMLAQGLNIPIVDAETKEDRLKVLINYFSDNRNNHDFYTFRFFFCELLNLINVIGQIYFVDFFLGGEFSTYGSDVIAMSELPSKERIDPMARVFPKVIIKYYYILYTYWTLQMFRLRNALFINMVLLGQFRTLMVCVFCR